MRSRLRVQVLLALFCAFLPLLAGCDTTQTVIGPSPREGSPPPSGGGGNPPPTGVRLRISTPDLTVDARCPSVTITITAETEGSSNNTVIWDYASTEGPSGNFVPAPNNGPSATLTLSRESRHRVVARWTQDSSVVSNTLNIRMIGSCDGGGGGTNMTCRLSAHPDEIRPGESSELEWLSTNAVRVDKSWTSDARLNGTSRVSPSRDTDYDIQCFDSSGNRLTSSTRVRVRTPTQPGTPRVTLTANPRTINLGGTSNITIVTENVDSCQGTAGHIGPVALSGTFPVSPTVTTTYRVHCTGPFGPAEDDETVTVQTTVRIEPGSLSLTAPGLNCTNTTGRFTVVPDQPVTWRSNDPAIARIDASGNVTATSAGSTTITATNASGQTASATVTVAQCPGSQAPSCTLTDNPPSIMQGGSATLSWTSSNVTSITISGGGLSGNRATSGSEPVSPASTTTYRIDCSGPGGSTSSSATLTVTPAPVPTCPMNANPTSVTSGGTSVISWSSTHATSVTAVAGFTPGSALALSGNRTVVLAQTTIFTIRCDGPGGSRTESVTVVVTGPACPSTIDYSPPGGAIAVNQTITLRASWPTSGCGDPFWGSSDPSRGQIVGADRVIVIDGRQYPAGHNAVMRRIARGTYSAFVQANIPSPQPSRSYNWTDASALPAPTAVGPAPTAAIMFEVTPDGRVMYNGRPVEQTGPPRQ